jgi:hypothetical protein
MCGEDCRRFGPPEKLTSSDWNPAQTTAGAPVCRRQSRQWHQDTWNGSLSATMRTAPQKQRPCRVTPIV